MFNFSLSTQKYISEWKEWIHAVSKKDALQSMLLVSVLKVRA